jgi:hypothetical protein
VAQLVEVSSELFIDIILPASLWPWDWLGLEEWVKVKESPKRPGVAQRVPGSLGSQISWHSAREGDEVVSLTHRPPLPPEMFLVLIFTRGWADHKAMVRSEGNVSLKNPMTPPAIDPGTVRLVAQRLNHYATPGPSRSEYQEYFQGSKCSRCVLLATLPPSCADCHEIWEPQPPGNLRACPDLYRDCCTIIFTL